MLIIPQLKTVVILTPRTGSATLIQLVRKKYPSTIMLYRHMEADGVPMGYDVWSKIGVVREPVARLFSAYKSCRSLDPRLKPSATSFEQWLLNNEIRSPSCHDNSSSAFYPSFTVRHYLPENRKSQWWYLRPDLGTKIYRFHRMAEIYARLELELPTVDQYLGVTPRETMPDLSAAVKHHIEQHFSWDLENWS